MKRVVIVGLPRCGTTLVATLLAAQRQCSFITDYIPAFHEAAGRLGVRWTTPLSLTQRRVALAIVRDQFLRLRHPVLVLPDGFSTLDELHQRVLAEVAGEGDAVVGHKLVLDPKEVRELLDTTALYCVIVYRDPRDAALSFWHRTGGGVEGYLETWRGMLRLADELRHHPRLVVLRYEAIVEDPRAGLKPLERALQLEVDPNVDVLTFQRGIRAGPVPWAENSAFGDVRSRFDRQPIERWTEHRGSPVVRYAAWLCAEEIRRLGYREFPEGFGLRTRATFVRQQGSAALARGMKQLADQASERLSRWCPPVRHPGEDAP